MAAIHYSVKKFRQEFEEDPGLATNSLSKKMTTQIDKHGDKLFTDPITVAPLPQKTDTIYHQRTNYILGQFFRGIRRGEQLHTSATPGNAGPTSQ